VRLTKISIGEGARNIGPARNPCSQHFKDLYLNHYPWATYPLSVYSLANPNCVTYVSDIKCQISLRKDKYISLGEIFYV